MRYFPYFILLSGEKISFSFLGQITYINIKQNNNVSLLKLLVHNSNLTILIYLFSKHSWQSLKLFSIIIMLILPGSHEYILTSGEQRDINPYKRKSLKKSSYFVQPFPRLLPNRY